MKRKGIKKPEKVPVRPHPPLAAIIIGSAMKGCLIVLILGCALAYVCFFSIVFIYHQKAPIPAEASYILYASLLAITGILIWLIGHEAIVAASEVLKPYLPSKTSK